MIPLRDDVPASRPPVVTYALVAGCAAVFLLQLLDSEGSMVERFGLLPARLEAPEASIVVRDGRGGAHTVLPAAVPEWLTLLTCIFLHGGWMHFLGNMLFLWIFGDNVEDRFGRVKFLLFYVGCGVAASMAHLLTSKGSTVPTIGASGAIAGVMGAYMFLYPRSKVQMLVIWGFFVDVLVIPAPFFLGYWFVLQLVQGSVDRGLGAGVAWWAHIGGFVVGAAAAGSLLLWERLRPRPEQVVFQRRRYGFVPPPLRRPPF